MPKLVKIKQSKSKQGASIDAQATTPPDTGNQQDVMLNLFQHLYKRRGQQQSSRDEKKLFNQPHRLFLQSMLVQILRQVQDDA